MSMWVKQSKGMLACCGGCGSGAVAIVAAMIRGGCGDGSSSGSGGGGSWESVCVRVTGMVGVGLWGLVTW